MNNSLNFSTVKAFSTSTTVNVTAMTITNTDYRVFMGLGASGNLQTFTSPGLLFNPLADELRCNGLKSTSKLTTLGLEINPVTPVSVANGGTVALSTSVSYNILRTTADGTIAGATLNLPASPVDGQTVKLVVTGAITVVSGTVATATVPAVTTLNAGTLTLLVYNTAAGKWFAGK
jgi:hypothetical protein